MNLNNVVIAEVGSVHDGSFGNACKLIELAASCGSDVVKFQTHIASAETILSAPNPIYFDSESRYDYFTRTSFSLQQWKSLKKHCDKFGVVFLSSPFSIESIDLLEEIGCPIYKVPSGEVTNHYMLEKLADICKPVILSSGMSSWDELDAAVSILIDKVDLVVMQCTTSYPCPIPLVGLNVLAEMKVRYGENIKVGFSDHTTGVAAGIAAAALGATVIEKHFTFSNSMYGSDAKNAMEPSEFIQYATAIKDVWKMLDSPVDKSDCTIYSDMKSIFEKSIVAASDLNEGELLTIEKIRFKKPGDGISASKYKDVLGKMLKTSIAADQQILPGNLV